MKSPLLLILMGALVTGCSTIHFENGETLPDPDTRSPWSINALSFGLFGDDPTEFLDISEGKRVSQWYHHAIFQMAELSNPLELNKVCRGLDWNTVTMEVTPANAFIGLTDNLLLLNASSAGLDLWSIWSVEYSCKP